MSEDAFEIPWIHPQDVHYVGRGRLRIVIYARRRFHYDLYVEFVNHS